jgi:hypothetical protein
MSVIGTYARLDPPDLEGLRSNPQWLRALWEKQIASAEVIDVDQAWQAIAWLLSRVAAPGPEMRAEGLGFPIVRSPAALLNGAGGTKEPRLEAPYGPATSLSAEHVATLSRWLTTVPSDSLRAAFDATAMDEADVYPPMWLEDPEALEEYVLPCFESLKDFIARAADAKQPVLVFFT